MELKIMVNGPAGVGKTALIIRCISGNWIPDYDPTIEDSYRKQMLVDEEVSVLDIFDVAESEGGYSVLRDNYMRHSGVYVIVFDVTYRHSFDEVDDYYKQICRVRDEEHPRVLVFGNKTDLEAQRQVSFNEATIYCASIKAPYREGSVKDNINIEETWQEVVRTYRKTGPCCVPQETKK